MKEARVTWSKSRNEWVIRFWSKRENEWLEDSAYPVKDVNSETEAGWVSEFMIQRLYDLQDLGYKIIFM